MSDEATFDPDSLRKEFADYCADVEPGIKAKAPRLNQLETLALIGMTVFQAAKELKHEKAASIAALEAANARIAELEAERDALLAAAGKDAVASSCESCDGEGLIGSHACPDCHPAQAAQSVEPRRRGRGERVRRINHKLTDEQADAAIAAGGAQEAATDSESKPPEYKGCIEWSNYRNRQGYGSLKADGKMSLAHRVMYCDYHGVTMDSIKHLVVRHACDNPPCFNPAHLLLGTHADNTRDKMERGRHARGERNGQSKLSQHQVAQIRSLYVRGSKEFGIPALAKKFGVGQSTIRKVVLKLRWTHVAVANGEQA